MKKTSKSEKNFSETINALPGQPLTAPVETASGLLKLFTDGVKDMYWSEKHLVKALPKMISAADSPELKEVITDHLEVTKKHVDRLEKVFELLSVKKQATKCNSMEGLVMSGEKVIENTLSGTVARDTGVIMAALKVENFEITSYQGLIQVATQLGETEIAELLRLNLADEMEADDMLTEMSQKNEQSVTASSAGDAI